MKKLMLYAVAALLLLTLAACGNSDTNESSIGTETGVNTQGNTETDAETPPEPESPATVTSFVISSEKNPGIYEDIVATVENNTINIKAGLLCDTNALKKAVLDVVTDGVSYSVGKNVYSAEGDPKPADLTGGARLTVTDAEGLRRVYEIKISYADSRLPVIHVNTSDGADVTTKEKYADATITIDVEGTDGWYLPEGAASLGETSVGIKGRGNSTWVWPKKPYKIKFDEKTSVLGMEKAKSWVLIANYADYSLIRNYVAFEGSRVLSEELSPLHQYPVNLFLNGKYLGVYTLGEDKDVAKGRIELPEATNDVDTSYLIEIGGYDDGDVKDVDYFMAGDVRWCTVQYPEDELTEEQFNYIKEYCLHANEDVKFLDGWEEHLDLDSFVNWFISSELFYNLDSCFRRSCFMMKEPGGKLKMGPVWDFDLAIGNHHDDYDEYDKWMCTMQEHGYIKTNWYQSLLEDETFRKRLREIWDEKKDELLERTLYCIDNMGATVAPSAEYNFEVWDIMGDRKLVAQSLMVDELKTYEEHIEYIRNFIINRWNWMDANI
ncbi:MAG: CotH kinase family protein [Clostridia bacterium]|nr:CotH kinase family protein [Clostridia bacterium]